MKSALYTLDVETKALAPVPDLVPIFKGTVIFFENTELKEYLSRPAATTEEIYVKAIAEKFALEKKQVVRELAQHGIMSILTPPQGLTVNTLNKYFELKARRAL